MTPLYLGTFRELVQKAMEALDEQERVRCYQEVEKILLKYVVAIPLFPTRILMAYNKKVRGVRGNDLASIIVTKD